MGTIIPAILTDNLDEFISSLNLVDSFPNVTAVHIDFADNNFVSNKTLKPDTVPNLPMKYEFVAHLMTTEPGKYLDDLRGAGFEIVATHIESVNNIKEFRNLLKNIKELGMQPQPVVNPKTNVEVLLPILKEVDRVQIMTVDPGFYGSKYIPGDDKINFLRQNNFYGTITVDGGISKQNIKSLLIAGADFLTVGSNIFKKEDPKKAYMELLKEAGN